MSRETMATILVAEAYRATTWDDALAVPMNPRRVKRLLNIYESTSWNCAETMNRAAGAYLVSRAIRLEARKDHP